MTVDVNDDKRAVSLIHALLAVMNAMYAVRDASPTVDHSHHIKSVGDELAWQLARRMNHEDVSGQSVTYRAGWVGVVLRIDQFVRSLRHVEREVTWGTKTYGD